MDSSAVPTNASNCTDALAHSSCSPAPSPASWVNLSHLDGNLSDPCGPNRTDLGGRDSLCPPTGSPSMITAITIMALYSIVCVVGLFGNFLVMYVIVRYKFRKEEQQGRNLALAQDPTCQLWLDFKALCAPLSVSVKIQAAQAEAVNSLPGNIIFKDQLKANNHHTVEE
uniref:mu-type opioid receptor isoform X3 n=1 Tax=Macaca mulatta TaxID=9544 RepID=UPI0010A20CFB|nr:mu-type opioid receptor isoform X3 [Macaca mulatta]